MEQVHMIPRTYLTNVRGVCKKMNSLVQDFFPEEVFHLILAKNSPSQVLQLFGLNPKLKALFDKNIQECNRSLDDHNVVENEGNDDDSQSEDEDEEWDGDSLSDDYIHRALEYCQGGIVRGLTHWNAVARDDVELHVAVITGEPDEDNRMFLALKNRTLAFDFDEREGGALTCTRSISSTPASPHAEWLASRVLAFLRRSGVDIRRLEPSRDADVDGWRLTAAPRDPAGRLGLQFVTGVSIG